MNFCRLAAMTKVSNRAMLRRLNIGWKFVRGRESLERKVASTISTSIQSTLIPVAIFSPSATILIFNRFHHTSHPT
jgi:hypothetical protein